MSLLSEYTELREMFEALKASGKLKASLIPIIEAKIISIGEDVGYKEPAKKTEPKAKRETGNSLTVGELKKSVAALVKVAKEFKDVYNPAAAYLIYNNGKLAFRHGENYALKSLNWKSDPFAVSWERITKYLDTFDADDTIRFVELNQEREKATIERVSGGKFERVPDRQGARNNTVQIEVTQSGGRKHAGQFPAMPVDDIPELPDSEAECDVYAKLTPEDYKIMDKAKVYCSKDETRPALTCIMITTNGIITSDAYTAYYYKKNYPTNVAVMPTQADILKNLAPEGAKVCNVKNDKKEYLLAKTSDVYLLLHQECAAPKDREYFSDYLREALTKDFNNHVTISRTELKKWLETIKFKRDKASAVNVDIVVDKKSSAAATVRLLIDNENAAINSQTEIIGTYLNKRLEEYETSVNYRFLERMLKTFNQTNITMNKNLQSSNRELLFREAGDAMKGSETVLLMTIYKGN